LVFHFTGSNLDQRYYSDIYLQADNILSSLHGRENIYGVLNELYLADSCILTPYHYTEIYLSAFFSFLSDSNNLSLILIQCSSVTLATCTILGIMSLYTSKQPTAASSKILIIAFCAIFIGPSFQCFKPLLDILNYYGNSEVLLLENPSHLKHFLLFKNYPFYIVCIIYVLNINQINSRQTYSLLSLGTILNVGLFPAICGLGLLQFISDNRKFNYINESLKSATVLIITIILFILAYFLFGKNPFHLENSFIHDFFEHLNWKGEIIRFIGRIILPLVYLLILYIPFFLILLFQRKQALKENPNLFYKFISIIFFSISGGLISHALLKGVDSLQFLSYTMPLIHVLVIYSVFSVSNKPLLFIVLVFFLVTNFKEFSVYTKQFHFSDKFIAEYGESFEKTLVRKIDKNEVIGLVLSKKTISTTPVAIWHQHPLVRFLRAKGRNKFVYLNDPYSKFNLKTISISSDGFIPAVKFIDPSIKNYKLLLTQFVNKFKVRHIVFEDMNTKLEFKNILTFSLID